MRRTLFISIILTMFLSVSACRDNSVKKIKADYLEIGLGQSLYSGYNKLERETVQSLTDAYNDIEYIGQTSNQINFENAITVTFIYKDQISGVLVIDEKGIFQLRDGVENYQIDPIMIYMNKQ